MNWTQEPWFLNLPKVTQEEIIKGYQDGNMVDRDIDKFRLIYTPSSKSTTKPFDTIDKFSFNPLIAAGRASKSSDDALTATGAAIGAAVKSSAQEVKNISKIVSDKILTPFFNCFGGKFFTAPINTLDKTNDINFSYGQLYSIYSLCRYMFAMDKTSQSLSDPKFNVSIIPIIKTTYSKDIPIIAENIWSKGLPDNVALTLLNTIVDTLKITINQIQNEYNLQTYRILVPGLTNMFEQTFTENYISTPLNAFNNTEELSKLGIINNNGNISVNNINDTLIKIEDILRNYELTARNSCLIQLKDQTMNYVNPVRESAAPQPPIDPNVMTPNERIRRQGAQQIAQMTPQQRTTQNAQQHAIADVGTGFAGLGDGSGSKYQFNQMMANAAKQYGLDPTVLTTMMGPQSKDPATEVNVPAQWRDAFNKDYEALLKKYGATPPQQQ